MRRFQPFFCAFALLLALPGPAVAQAVDTAQRAEALRLFELAKKAMDAGDYRAACPLFEESLRSFSGTGTLYQAGNCYEGLGDLVTAWRRFHAASEKANADGQPERATEAARRAGALEPRVPKLAVVVPDNVKVTGLELELDGAPLGPLRWDLAEPASPGKHVLRAKAPGCHPWERAVEVRAGNGISVAVVPALEPLVAVHRGAAPPREATAHAASPARVEPPATALEPHEIAGLSILGAGVALSAAGVVVSWSTWTDHAEKLRACRGGTCDNAQLASELDQQRVPAVILLTTGLAASGVGAVVLLFGGESGDPKAASWLRPSVGPGLAFVSATGTF